MNDFLIRQKLAYITASKMAASVPPACECSLLQLAVRKHTAGENMAKCYEELGPYEFVICFKEVLLFFLLTSYGMENTTQKNSFTTLKCSARKNIFGNSLCFKQGELALALKCMS